MKVPTTLIGSTVERTAFDFRSRATDWTRNS